MGDWYKFYDVGRKKEQWFEGKNYRLFRLLTEIESKGTYHFLPSSSLIEGKKYATNAKRSSNTDR